jgi:predicted acyl esterase
MVEDGSYFFTFFTAERVALLRGFFDRYLKGVENDWESPRVTVVLRTPEGESVVLSGTDWPLPQTKIQRLYLDFEDNSLKSAAPQRDTTARYLPAVQEITLATAPLESELALAGPASLHLWLACETEDTDLFATIQAIMPDGEELTFLAAVDPASPLTQGWLRVSQRKLDQSKSTDLAPIHAHDERQPLVPGQIYEVQVALWPTSLRLPRGSQLRLTIGGKDFRRPPGEKDEPVVFMSHDDPRDRPPAIYDGAVTLFAGPDRASSLLLPAVDH